MMHVTHPMAVLARVCAFLSLALALCPAGAQDDPPGEPAFTRIRIVGAEDGLPRPGVVILADSMRTGADLVRRTGFFVAEDQRVQRLRHAARSWRSDPAGEVLLPTAMLRGHYRMDAAEPFSFSDRGPRAGDDDVPTWPVCEREPVGVRAIDAAGKPLARFPVALHTGGRDVAVALTDDVGRAVLGLPADTSARIWLAPAGWLGPLDGMPTIVADRAGRRGTDLVVPPHGSVLVYGRRDGLPLKTRLGGINVRVEGRHEWVVSSHPQGETIGYGFELPFVALGTTLEVHATMRGTERLQVNGPSKAGGEVLVPVDVPYSPEVWFTLAGPKTAANPQLRLRLVTDAGVREAYAQRDPRGAWQLGSLALAGTRIERIEFDTFVPATDTTPPCSWIATVPLCQPLRDGELDLGTVTLTPGPTLHGKVVDAAGNALPDIEVVAGTADQRPAYLLRTDATGHFAWTMPLPRDASGALRPLTAKARTPQLASATVPAASDGQPIVLRLVEPAPPARSVVRRDQGTVTARIVAPQPAPVGLSWLLRGERGFAASAKATRNHDGTLELEFTRLQADRYTLVTDDATYHTRIVLAGIEVPGDGPSTDGRLGSISMDGEPKVLAVHVLDTKGVPIAGVRATAPGGIFVTDGTGTLRIATHDTTSRLAATFAGNGLRARVVDALQHGMDVVMQPAGTFQVRIDGLPADLAMDRVEVWVRHERRELFLGPRGPLGADGTVALELPQPGKYFVNLLVRLGHEAEGSRTLVAMREAPVEIGDGPPTPVQWTLTAAEQARLRERLRQ